MDAFFRTRLHGAKFECLIDTSGPFIASTFGEVHFGVCSLNHVGPWQCLPDAAPLSSELEPRAWWIVKYDHERCIELPGALTRPDIAAFGARMGIPLWHPNQLPIEPIEFFYRSPAFAALCTWVSAHPVKAKRAASHAASHYYLPDWYERARVAFVFR